MSKEKQDKEKSQTPGITNTEASFSVIKSLLQTRNSGEVVLVTNQIDDTEGLGAIATLPFRKGSINLDIGGGAFTTASEFLSKWYGVTNIVYDPYQRSEEHNSEVIRIVNECPVDSVTSNSVLNVILDNAQRAAHIKLAYDSLKSGGIAFFKIWRGNGSGIPTPETFQANKEAKYYLDEIADVFGTGNVELILDDIGNTIFAHKK